MQLVESYAGPKAH